MADTDIPSTGAPRPGGPEHFDFDSVHTGLLDCVQVNLAVLADHHHGAGTHLRAGAALDFRTWKRPDGLPTVEPRRTSNSARCPACWDCARNGVSGCPGPNCRPPSPGAAPPTM